MDVQPHGEQVEQAALAMKRRAFARWPFSQHLVPVRCSQGRSTPVVPMSCRNLSAAGIGLVSPRPVPVGTPVGVTLRSVVRGAVEVRGRVVRCAQSGDRFEVGVALDDLIELREFAPSDPMTHRPLREHVDPASVRGRVLVVSGTAGDRALLARSLKSTAVVVTTVASADGATDVASTDVALLTCNEGDDEPGSVLLDLYEKGFAGRAILIAPDRSPRVRRIVDKLPLAAVLVKPLADDALLHALSEVAQPDALQRVRGAA